MFFVRVFLFLMSRRADDSSFPDVASQSPPSDVGRRTASKPSMPTLTNVRAVQGGAEQDTFHQPVAQASAASEQDGVTREEMVKLFGSALRVR